MSAKGVVMENVAFSYGSDHAQGPRLFEHFSLALGEAGVLAILGASGTGKSTLLGLLGGVLEPVAGSIRYEGFAANGAAPAVGFVFQTAALVPWRTIMANVLLGAEIIGERRIGTAVEEARRLLAKYGLGGYEAHYPHELSGGMQQRASIIRAIVSGAQILLLDEPFSNSDFVTRHALQNEISDLIEERNLLVALVTHDLEDALRFGDRIVVVGDRPLRVLDSFNIEIPRRSRLAVRDSAAPQLMPYLERIWRALETKQGQVLQ